MKRVVYLLLGLLIVLHQLDWYRGEATLVGGVLPVGAAYHVAISLGAAAVWWLAARYAWPTDAQLLHELDEAGGAGGA